MDAPDGATLLAQGRAAPLAFGHSPRGYFRPDDGGGVNRLWITSHSPLTCAPAASENHNAVQAGEPMAAPGDDFTIRTKAPPTSSTGPFPVDSGCYGLRPHALQCYYFNSRTMKQSVPP